jgi:hypothetical protein
MRHNRLTRRQFSTAAALGSVAALAGCASDDEESDDTDNESTDDVDDFDEEDLEDDPVGSLTVVLENEDGDPVSSNVEVEVDPDEDTMTYGFGEEDIEDGEHTITPEETGEHTVTVESTEDEFDPVEEDVTVGEEEETVTITLEGASADE